MLLPSPFRLHYYGPVTRVKTMSGRWTPLGDPVTDYCYEIGIGIGRDRFGRIRLPVTAQGAPSLPDGHAVSVPFRALESYPPAPPFTISLLGKVTQSETHHQARYRVCSLDIMAADPAWRGDPTIVNGLRYFCGDADGPPPPADHPRGHPHLLPARLIVPAPHLRGRK